MYASRRLLPTLFLIGLSACRHDPPADNGPPSDFSSISKAASYDIALTPGDGEYTYRSGALRDMTGDGIPDAVITISSYMKNNPNSLLVLDGAGPGANVAATVFPKGVPVARHSNQVFFRDVDGDGRDDLLFSEAGIDYYPWTTADCVFGLALARADGSYEDVTAALPAAVRGKRAYSLAAGDFYGDGMVRIVHPGQSDPHLPMLISWDGSAFNANDSWIDLDFWYANRLGKNSNLGAPDLDGDGYDDLYLSGQLETPTNRVIFGGPSFGSDLAVAVLPEGPCGHMPWEDFNKEGVPWGRGADVNQVLFEDFDGDGDLDIASFAEEAHYYKPGILHEGDAGVTADLIANGGGIWYDGWFQVIENAGNRSFVDISGRVPDQNLGPRYYVALIPIDLDLDGDLDIIGHYWTKRWLDAPPPHWGSTLFFNDGKGFFTRRDAVEAFGVAEADRERDDVVGVGALFPTSITATEMRGLFLIPQPYDPHIKAIRFVAQGRLRSP